MATGLHRNTMVNTEGGTDDEEFRVAALVDRVNTTAEIWLGLTLHCSQCHNHKYDPFSQKEYYQLLAFFNGTADRGRSNDPTMPAPTPEETARIEALKAEIANLQKDAGPKPAPGVTAKIAELQKQLAAIKPVTTLVMKELPQRRPTNVMIRGNHKNLGEVVQPGVPARLHALPKDAPPNRLGLAQWLVAPGKPADGARDDESPLGAVLRPRLRRNERGLRHPGRPPHASGVARLAGDRVGPRRNGASRQSTSSSSPRRRIDSPARVQRRC